MAKRFTITTAEYQRYHSLCAATQSLLTLNHVALITVLSVWHLMISDLPLSHPILLLGTVLLPLLLSLWGNLNGSYKGAIGICFISLLYFTSGVTHWFHPYLWPIGMSETLLSGGLFILALMYSRWKALSELPRQDT